jgi:hypothetical protein
LRSLPALSHWIRDLLITAPSAVMLRAVLDAAIKFGCQKPLDHYCNVCDSAGMYSVFIIGAAIVLYLLASICVLRQYERGVVLFLGKFKGVRGPKRQLDVRKLDHKGGSCDDHNWGGAVRNCSRSAAVRRLPALQLAFPHDTLVPLVHAFYPIFKLAAALGQLFCDFVGTAGDVATD